VHEHLHAEREAELGQVAADEPVAKDAQGRPAQLPPHADDDLLPRAVGGHVGAEVAREIDHHGDHQLGDGGVESGARARHENPVRRGGGDIDGADVHSAPNEGHEGRMAREQGRRPREYCDPTR
jgi:hypothetical protein